MAQNVPGPGRRVARWWPSGAHGDQDRAALGRSARSALQAVVRRVARAACASSASISRSPTGIAALKTLLARQPMSFSPAIGRRRSRGSDSIATSLQRALPAPAPREHRRRHRESRRAGPRPHVPGARRLCCSTTMPLTLIADMVGAERAHAAIKDVMHEPGASRVVGLYDALRDLAAPLRHGLTAPGGHLGGGNPAYGDLRRRAKARSRSARSSRISARGCTKASDLADGADPSAVFATKTAIEWEAWAAARDLPLVALKSGQSHFDRDDWGLASQCTVLETAHTIATRYLDDVATRHVGGTTDARRARRGARRSAAHRRIGSGRRCFNNSPTNADPGIVASAGPRYFGFVTGGAVPVTVAADWLASAWDQNACLYVTSPAVAVIEDIVAGWLLELLGLPRSASVGFVTGCHMANFTCLAAARHEVLRRAGWNVEAQGLQRAPRVRVIAGGEVHISAVGALRYLGLRHRGDRNHSRRRPGPHARGRARRGARDGATGPTIVCAQAGNVSTGASDPIDAIVSQRARARRVGPRRRRVRIVGGGRARAAIAGRAASRHADSWATDAHKWLNVPYDSGLAIVARRRAASRGDEHEGVVPAARRGRRAHRHGLGAGIVAPLARAAALRVDPHARTRRHRRHRAPQLRARAAHGRSPVDRSRASRS